MPVWDTNYLALALALVDPSEEQNRRCRIPPPLEAPGDPVFPVAFRSVLETEESTAAFTVTTKDYQLFINKSNLFFLHQIKFFALVS